MDSSDDVFGDICILFLVVLIDIGGIIGGREGVVLTFEGEGLRGKVKVTEDFGIVFAGCEFFISILARCIDSIRVLQGFEVNLKDDVLALFGLIGAIEKIGIGVDIDAVDDIELIGGSIVMIGLLKGDKALPCRENRDCSILISDVRRAFDQLVLVALSAAIDKGGGSKAETGLLLASVIIVIEAVILCRGDRTSAAFSKRIDDHGSAFKDSGHEVFGLRASFIGADDFDFTRLFGVKIELAVLFVDPSEFIVGLVDLFGIPDEVVAIG